MLNNPESARSRAGGLATAVADKVAIIWLDRPEKLNAMGRDFWPSLRTVLSELESGGRRRAVVITGRGRAFSAGGDVESFEDLKDEAARRAFQVDCMRTFAAIERCNLPVIAAINGLALGGGCELAMACDIVLAGESAVFGMPEARLGLVPGYGVLRGPDIIGRQWTNWLIMASETIDAAQAHRIGLVQKVVPDAALLGEAIDLARRIAGRAPESLAVTKALVDGETPVARFEASIEALTKLSSSPDGGEGRRAFLERREPRFDEAADPRDPTKGS